MRSVIQQQAAPAPGTVASRGAAPLRRHETLAAYLFLSPTILLFLIFIAGPLLGAVALTVLPLVLAIGLGVVTLVLLVRWLVP